MLIQLCTSQDVIDRFGGAAALRQCLDPTGTGNIDQAILNRAIEDASSDVMASAGNKAKLWLLDLTLVPPFVIRLVADRAIYYCWKYGTHGKGIPEHIQTAYEHNNEEMRLLYATQNKRSQLKTRRGGQEMGSFGKEASP